VYPVRYPFDFSFAVERLFDRVRPDAVALVELETWPNFLAVAEARRVPVAIINGRISEKSYPRYRWIRPIMAGMLRRVGWIGAQTETIAGRFRALGAEATRIEVIPTLKYDNAQVADTVAGQEALGAAMGLEGGMRLIVGGSTGPGEEEALLEMYGALKGRFEGLRLAIVPRHPEVVGQVAAAIGRRGWKAVLRTERPDGDEGKRETRNAKLETDEVFLLNTMGELRKMYALAFGVFVGRSLIKKGGGGSDMIEVAALGKPCCFGPFTSNFAEAVELLTGAGVAKTVKCPTRLTKTVEKWLEKPEEAEAMGRKAQELIRKQQAARATDVYVKKLLGLMGE
jgi:3-deoxy-D-manno-octulosonic-acid transferase